MEPPDRSNKPGLCCRNGTILSGVYDPLLIPFKPGDPQFYKLFGCHHGSLHA
jgi:hypothetical protein